LGWSHYLVLGLEKVNGENALIVLTYNFRRLLNLIGVTMFKKVIQAIQKGDMETIRKEIEEHIALLWLYFGVWRPNNPFSTLESIFVENGLN
jgi:hypothetical protein